MVKPVKTASVLPQSAATPHRDEARLALAAQLGVALGRNDVDIVILNDVPAPLARHVVLDGIRVWRPSNVSRWCAGSFVWWRRWKKRAPERCWN